ncbi:MAG: branched-chain amino acid ABC transporter permease [Thermodesulfobacteriota bacterium]
MNFQAVRRRERLDRAVKARSDDIFALTSWRELLYLVVPPLALVILLLAAASAASPYQHRVLAVGLVFGLLALSWDFLAATGLISLGQSLFFGLGAYLAGMMNHYWGWPCWITIPAAALAGGVLCAVLLAPVLRLRGIYFAMITLIIPLILVRIIEATRILGGTEGLSSLSGLPGRGWEATVGLSAFLAALFGLRRLLRTDYGLVLRSIRDDDRAVMSDGVNVYWLRTQAIFIAGAVGAFGGAFMTHLYRFVGMPAFTLDYSILPIAAAVVGGVGTLAGPALGALLLVPLSEALRPLGSLRIVAYGLCLVVFVVMLPEGLFPYLRRKYQQFERWRDLAHD